MFAALADGLVVGDAIRMAYGNPAIRADVAFMEWLTKPKTTIWKTFEMTHRLTIDKDFIIHKEA